MAHAVLVVGPPCGGKTTFALRSKRPQDQVIDFDLIAQRMGSPVSHGHPPRVAARANQSRSETLRRVQAGRTKAERVFIVSANPHAERTYLWVDDIVVLDPGADEAHRRATEAKRPHEWHAFIDQWYAARRR